MAKAKLAEETWGDLVALRTAQASVAAMRWAWLDMGATTLASSAALLQASFAAVARAGCLWMSSLPAQMACQMSAPNRNLNDRMLAKH